MSSPESFVSVTVRAMELQDIPRVREIDLASFSLPWPERSFRFEITENPASRLWVAEVNPPDGQAVVAGMIVMWQVLDEAHIGTFAIHPDFRRHGIGQKLLAESLLQAYESGVRKCYLEVRRSNIAAQQLYQRFGFEVVSVRNRYYRDNGEDALMMTLNFLHPSLLRTLADSAGNPHSMGSLSEEAKHGSS